MEKQSEINTFLRKNSKILTSPRISCADSFSLSLSLAIKQKENSASHRVCLCKAKSSHFENRSSNKFSNISNDKNHLFSKMKLFCFIINIYYQNLQQHKKKESKTKLKKKILIFFFFIISDLNRFRKYCSMAKYSTYFIKRRTYTEFRFVRMKQATLPPTDGCFNLTKSLSHLGPSRGIVWQRNIATS